MRILIIFSLLVLNSCSVFKGKNSKITVSGKIEIHKPYCGGARPTEEMAKGTDSPYANTTFYVKSKMNNDAELETVGKFETDENGSFSVKLKKGSYFVIQENKVLLFPQFIVKNANTENKFLQYIGDKEAKMEYEKVDFMLDVENEIVGSKKIFNYSYKAKCFSGINYLLKYVGPLPQ